MKTKEKLFLPFYFILLYKKKQNIKGKINDEK